MSYGKKILFPLSLIAGFGLALAGTARGDDTPAPSAASQQPAAAAAENTSGKKETESQKEMDLGTVNVNGIRASLAASLQTKRNADAVVDAITAEDIGKFPTTNVAEALALIPGITLDYNMPATQRVSVDGLDPSLNVSLLDGHPVAQAMWLFGDSPNRGFNFSLLPSELVGKVEVFKSPEARLPEGSLGGLIVMHTPEPLALKNNTVAGSVGYNYSAIVSQGKPVVSVLYSGKNDNGSFGYMISGQHYEQVVSRQGMENYGYSTAQSLADAQTKAGDPTIQNEITAGTIQGGDLMPNELSAANFNQVERRNSLFANFQFKPSDNFETTLSVMYMLDDLANTNQSTYAWASLRPTGITSLGNVVDGVITTGTSMADNNGTQLPNGNTDGPCTSDTAGACAQKAISLSDNFARESEITTQGVDWRTRYSGYDWNLATQAGISNSTNPITQVLKEIAYGGSFSWNLNKGFTFLDPATANSPNYWADYGWGGNHVLLPYAARDTYAGADFTKDLEGVFTDYMIGARIADHWESQAESNYGGFTPKTLNQIGYGGLTDLQGASDLGLSQSMISHVQTSGFNAIAGANPLSATANYPANPDPNTYWDNTWNVQQDNTAEYVQGDFTSGAVHGNVGVRLVQVKTTAQGYSIPGACAASDNFATCTPFPSGFGWVTYSSTHNEFLPAANVAWDASSDVVVRGALSTTVAFAPYNQLAPYFEANDTVLTAAAGNPNLSPYKSNNLDGSVEWYFAPSSALAGSLFYKDVTNYIVNQAQFEQRINGSWTLPGYLNATGNALIGSGQCTAAGVCQYSVTQPVDGGAAKVKGFAVSYQQAFADTGFGLRLNYTYSDATTSSGLAMPYNSKNTYSISPYFEQGPFSASLAYSYRSTYLAGGYVAGAAPASVDPYKELDASVGYNFNATWSLNFNGLNLLNSTYYEYLGSHIELEDEYKTGRQYVLSLGAKF